ncbi:hypothetical protein GCM10025859_46800 [Alicyclobacillus fastidiosus]|nr:hypothetical protein GCM10025859_46800 [Alicyclobacillus fastidiosus]
MFDGHAHGNHAHYGLGLDYQKDTDELIATDTGIDVLLERGENFLDGIEVDYDASTDEWSIINPSKGTTGITNRTRVFLAGKRCESQGLGHKYEGISGPRRLLNPHKGSDER